MQHIKDIEVASRKLFGALWFAIENQRSNQVLQNCSHEPRLGTVGFFRNRKGAAKRPRSLRIVLARHEHAPQDMEPRRHDRTVRAVEPLRNCQCSPTRLLGQDVIAADVENAGEHIEVRPDDATLVAVQSRIDPHSRPHQSLHEIAASAGAIQDANDSAAEICGLLACFVELPSAPSLLVAFLHADARLPFERRPPLEHLIAPAVGEDSQ